MTGSVRVLGIDPGLTRCGVGVVDVSRDRSAVYVHAGVIRTDPDLLLEQRLLAIARGIDAILDEYSPSAVAVERVFAQHNVRTVTGTAQVAGLAMVAATRAGVPVALHTPSEVKAAVTGNGRAEKAQVQEMVRRILDLPEKPTPADAADALAIAVTHGWRGSGGTVISLPSASTRTAAQRAWDEAAAGSAARAKAARRRLVR